MLVKEESDSSVEVEMESSMVQVVLFVVAEVVSVDIVEYDIDAVDIFAFVFPL